MHTNAPQHRITTASRTNSKHIIVVRNAYPNFVPIFDGLWPINLKLLSQIGDCSASHGAFCICDGRWVLFTTMN